MEYLIQYRIDKACELLQSSTLSVAEIAAAVGYTSQFSFSRVFKKHMNVAPSSYKKDQPDEGSGRNAGIRHLRSSKVPLQSAGS